MNLYLILGSVIAVLMAFLKFKSIKNDKLASRLEIQETKGKSDVIEAKREEIKKDLEEENKKIEKAKEEAHEQSAPEYWKGKL